MRVFFGRFGRGNSDSVILAWICLFPQNGYSAPFPFWVSAWPVVFLAWEHRARTVLPRLRVRIPKLPITPNSLLQRTKCSSR